jgi:hypothetical protein
MMGRKREVVRLKPRLEVLQSSLRSLPARIHPVKCDLQPKVVLMNHPSFRDHLLTRPCHVSHRDVACTAAARDFKNLVDEPAPPVSQTSIPTCERITRRV